MRRTAFSNDARRRRSDQANGLVSLESVFNRPTASLAHERSQNAHPLGRSLPAQLGDEGSIPVFVTRLAYL